MGADNREVAQLTHYRALLVIALCASLYGVTTRFPMHLTAGSAKVTRAYDDAGCGPVRDVSRVIAGPDGKAMTLCLLNFERTRAGLPPLVENPLLDRAAERHSSDMVRRHFFEHVNPDGATPQTRMAASGYSATGGENIAFGDGGLASPASIVDGWMHSPGHRANILQPTYREVGIGVTLGNTPNRAGSGLRSATYTTDFGG
jgi:uncharacterized protein YkwD